MVNCTPFAAVLSPSLSWCTMFPAQALAILARRPCNTESAVAKNESVGNSGLHIQGDARGRAAETSSGVTCQTTALGLQMAMGSSTSLQMLAPKRTHRSLGSAVAALQLELLGKLQLYFACTIATRGNSRNL